MINIPGFSECSWEDSKGLVLNDYHHPLELTPITHSGNWLDNSWLLLSFQFLSQLSLLTFLSTTINVNDYLLSLLYVYFQKKIIYNFNIKNNSEARYKEDIVSQIITAFW